MGRRLELAIKEDEALLQQLLKHEKHKMTYQKLQSLYMFKKDPSISLSKLCELLNKSQSQVKRWYKSYRDGGLDSLLYIPPRPGRRTPITRQIKDALSEQLNHEKFHCYDDIRQWLKTEYGVEVAYTTVHGLCRYRLGAKLKVARPSSIHKDESAAIGFKKTAHNSGALCSFY